MQTATPIYANPTFNYETNDYQRKVLSLQVERRNRVYGKNKDYKKKKFLTSFKLRERKNENVLPNWKNQ